MAQFKYLGSEVSPIKAPLRPLDSAFVLDGVFVVASVFPTL